MSIIKFTTRQSTPLSSTRTTSLLSSPSRHDANTVTSIRCYTSRRCYHSHSHYSPPITRTTTTHHQSVNTTRTIQHRSASTSTSTSGSTDVSIEKRPYRILGLQQIAIGSSSKSALVELWDNQFGLRKHNTYQSAKENVDEDIYVLGAGVLGSIEVDLMQPLDEAKKPAVHIPPLNHIGLWVDDIHACVDHLKKSGCRFAPGGIRKGASGYDVAFIHPRGNDEYPISGQGVLIELVQAPEHVIKEFEKQQANTTQEKEFVAQ